MLKLSHMGIVMPYGITYKESNAVGSWDSL